MAESEIHHLDSEINKLSRELDAKDELLKEFTTLLKGWKFLPKDGELLVSSPVGEAPGGLSVSAEVKSLEGRLLYHIGQAIIEYQKKCEPFLTTITT